MGENAKLSADGLEARSIGERAWDALREHQIPPTPRNFELFYTLFDGTNLPLEQQVRQLVASGKSLDASSIETLHRTYIDNAGDAAVVVAGADDLAEAARDIAEQVARGCEDITTYGGVLDRWRHQITPDTGADDLMRAVIALKTETDQASARNRTLEMQLSAEVERVARLREDLVQVRQEAATDALTGIPNRRAFDVRLRRAISHATTDPKAQFALLMLDVDHFKNFNDEHGHKTGDQVLRLVARLIADNVKGRDTAARFGGEEFAVLLAGAGLTAATTVAQQMCERLSSQRLIKRGTGKPIGQITMSIGVAAHTQGESGTKLIERADAALYEAKRSGRNRVCCASVAIIDV